LGDENEKSAFFVLEKGVEIKVKTGNRKLRKIHGKVAKFIESIDEKFVKVEVDGKKYDVPVCDLEVESR